MATELQKSALDKIVEKHGKRKVSISGVMREVGYDPNTAKNPKNLTESKGYKELLNKYGLTEGLITKALVADIKKKKAKRVEELKLGADLLHMRDRELGSSISSTLIQININPPNDARDKSNTEAISGVVSIKRPKD